MCERLTSLAKMGYDTRVTGHVTGHTHQISPNLEEMGLPRSSVTIRDVAAHAGVSHQTVSRVINGNERVTPETKSRVEAAIAVLGFFPNAAARSMARGRTMTLACISPNLTDYTFARIIEGAERMCREHGYYLVSTSAGDEATFASIIDELLSTRRVEGLLVINPYSDSRHMLIPESAPVVYVGARPRREPVSSVALDDVATGAAATEHLLSLGHRTIGVITGPMVEDCSQDRLQGYRSALEMHDVTLDLDIIVEGDWSASSGHAAVTRLAEDAGLPSALFAQNDQMAVGAIHAARELGMKIPDDLAVIGVDDMPLASYFDPPLTTMRQDLLEIGRQAAELLLLAVGTPGTPGEHQLLPAELVVRGTTAPNSERGGVLAKYVYDTSKDPGQLF